MARRAPTQWIAALDRFTCSWAAGDCDLAPALRQLAQSSRALEASSAARARCAAMAVALMPLEDEGAVAADSALLLQQMGAGSRFLSSTVAANPTAVAAVMNASLRSGDWVSAISVLRTSFFFDHATIAAYPAVAAAAVHAYATAGDWHAALTLFSSLHLGHERAAPQAALMKVLLDTGRWSTAVSVHSVAAAVVTAGDAQLHEGSNVVRLLSSVGQWELATKAASAHISASSGQLSTVIAAAHDGGRGHWQATLRVSAAVLAQQRITTLDRAAVAAVARACGTGARWMEAAQLVQMAGDAPGVLSVGVCLSLVFTFNECGQQALAHRAFSRLTALGVAGDPLRRAMNSMLRHSKSFPTAQHWRDSMVQKRLGIDAASYERLVELAARSGRWVDAANVASDMLRTTHTPRTFTHDHVQYAMSQGGAPWHVCVRCFAAMDARSVPGSEIAFKSVVGACIDQGQQAQAKALLEHTIRRGVGAL